jgi:ribosomal protein S27AE
VFTSQKEAEKVIQKCSVCNSPNIVTGDFRTTGKNYFRPKKTKFWTIKDSNIKTHAMMCVQCGAITHFGDVEKLRTLIEENKKESEEQK